MSGGRIAGNTLWMIEDLEPFPDAPAVGELCSPATFWAGPGELGLPADMMYEVEARVDEVVTETGIERVAHLQNGFATLLPDHIEGRGAVVLKGALVWDRYLWLNYRTRPSGQVRVLARHPVTQRVTRTPTRHAGWFSVTYDGSRELQRDGHVPPEHHVVSYALSVAIVSPS